MSVYEIIASVLGALGLIICASVKYVSVLAKVNLQH